MRSEAAKHRHSLTQVLTWAAIVLIYSIAVFFVLDRLGVPVTGLVAPATVLGVGLGFGAQRIVGDVLAGFFIITERQYGFGDVVSITVTGAGDPATGTVEDVTLRVTRMRSPNGEVITVPNGAIAKVVNLSRDWARAVVDVPVPTDVDVNRVNEILREVGREAFRDPALRPLLLDPPSVMGVESLGPRRRSTCGWSPARCPASSSRSAATCAPASSSPSATRAAACRRRRRSTSAVDGRRASRGGEVTRSGRRAARGEQPAVDARRSPPAAPRLAAGGRRMPAPPRAGRARRPSSSRCSSWRSARCT